MNWDSQWLAFLNQDLAHPLLDTLMAVLTVAAMPLLALQPVCLLAARRRREGLAMLAVLVLSLLPTLGLQFWLMRPRPVGVRQAMPTSAFPSFPSGHAAAAFGSAALVSLVWRRAGPAALLGAALVSFSRLYLGQHYPSDVLGGAILGVAAATAVYGGWYRPGGTARPRWAWLLWSQVAVVMLASLAAYLDLLHFDWLALPGADKGLHFLLLGGVAFLAVGWWAGQPPGTVLAVLSLLVAAEEALQALSPARSANLLDLAAALAGIVLFGRLSAIFCKRGMPEEPRYIDH